VATTTAPLPEWPAPGDPLARVIAAVDAACESLLEACTQFHARTGADLIVNTIPVPPARPLGNLGAKTPGDPVSVARRFNLALGDRAPGFVHVNDVAYLVERRGLDRWFDSRYWYEAKQPMAFEVVAEYCRNVAAIAGALLGRSKKCLVVDLDNTLWGGVVGDDGLGGIAIGQGDPLGEAYTDFQRYLRRLKERGILLAVSSKNDEGIAKRAFTDHPDMTLGLDDFVAFRANWAPKSENLRIIAHDLDLPLDALVFVDDNPAERAEVAMALPEVTVVPLPEDPAGYIPAVDGARLFEVPRLTAEDASRTSAYHARRASLAARQAATDIDAYLRSLDMRAALQPFDEVSLDRVTQLVNKTNQFNLTTPRVTLAEMRRVMTDPAAVTCTVRLRDRFAAHGLIAIAWGRVDERRLTLDAWLMSCRVLGRGVEQAVFNYLLAAARARDVSAVVGRFRPTGRNALVQGLYPSLGFTPVDGDDGEERWWLDVAAARPIDTCIAIEGPAS
jgi:FkbH-like protein